MNGPELLRTLCAWLSGVVERAALGLVACTVGAFGLVAGACLADLPAASCLSSADCGLSEMCVDLACVSPLTVTACDGLPPAGGLLGAPCGACGAGRWMCEAEGWACVGDVQNACGGCGPMPGALGAACGDCGGAWQCDGSELRCDRQPNGCGGCGALEPAFAAPGASCALDAGGPERDGVWLCADTTTLRCTSPLANACGGDAVLAQTPGQRCGPCGEGRWMCTGVDAVACCYGDRDRCGADAAPLNACGGCDPIPPLLDAPCGVCGTGRWALDCSVGRLTCEGERLNACGGCTTFAHALGTPCGSGQAWVCAGPNTLVCGAEAVVNPCGGGGVLDGTPGGACGPCVDGRYACVSPDRVACIGASPNNRCGGCGPLPAEPGAVCGPGLVWACASAARVDEPKLVCASNPDQDACGGPSAADQQPWEPCGECGGRWACEGLELRCVVAPERRPRTMYRDIDGDDFGDRDDPGQSLCGGTEGYAESATDCDDSTELVSPAQEEIPGNGVDDDCDRTTPD